MKGPILGCIADDLSGATDLCNNLVRAGMKVTLTIDVPAQDRLLDADAVVVALKSRTIPTNDAVAQSLQACRWLRQQGVRQIYFKVCSTFDSTPKGNIGPVIEVLMDELGCDFSCVVPAFPENDRTVYKGHLFVGDVLISESGMRNHPLTPMTDANLVRFLQQQLSASKNRRTGLIDFRSVAESSDAILRRIGELRRKGASIAIADTISNDDLSRLASALRDAPLITAGSGLAIRLPSVWGFCPSAESGELPPAHGRKVILSGSCSTATNAQILRFIQGGGAAHFLDSVTLSEGFDGQVEQILAWADTCWDRDPALPLLVYSTAEPSIVKETQERLGVEQSGELVESAFSMLARAFVSRGAGQLVVAGGETSGTCVRALDIKQMQIGPQIDPGVPWCYASSPLSAQGCIHITLKSGNFGSQDFFRKALKLLK
jgi:uncharacterized protein YgbK (DUF1537 family)